MTWACRPAATTTVAAPSTVSTAVWPSSPLVPTGSTRRAAPSCRRTCRTSSTHRSPARVATSTSSRRSPWPTDAVSANPSRSARASSRWSSPKAPRHRTRRTLTSKVPKSKDRNSKRRKVAVVEAPERFGFNFGSEAEYKRLEYRDKWCADCVGEETGLSSWVYGDPSTVKLAGGSGPWLPIQPGLPGTRPARPSGRSARRAWWHPGTERRGLRPAPDERARRDASRVVLHGERDQRLPGRPAQDPFRTCGHLRDPRVPPARPHLVGRTGRQRPRRIDPTEADAVGPAAGHHDRLADLQPLDGVHRRHQLRRRSTRRHRRRRDLPLPSLPPLRRRFLGAPARARRRGERHRRDP